MITEDRVTDKDSDWWNSLTSFFVFMFLKPPLKRHIENFKKVRKLFSNVTLVVSVSRKNEMMFEFIFLPHPSLGELWPVPGWSSFSNLLTLTSSVVIQHNDSMVGLYQGGSYTSTEQMSKYPNILERECWCVGSMVVSQMCGGGWGVFSLSLWHDNSPQCLGCITEYLVSGGGQIIAVFFISPSPPPSPTKQPIISRSRGISANLIPIFQIFLMTNEKGLRHLVSIKTLQHSSDKLILKFCFCPQGNYCWSSQGQLER